MGICVSYPATLVLLDEIASLHTLPLSQWLVTGTPFMFWGDNVDKHRSVRDMRSDHHRSLLHLYSILAGSSCTTDPTLSQHGRIASISSLPSVSLLPDATDISSMRSNLIVMVARFLTRYFKDLKPLSRAVASHIKVGEEVIFDHLFINNKRQILIDNGIHNISIAFLIECNALFQIYCV